MLRSATFVAALLAVSGSTFGSVAVTFTKPNGAALDTVVERTTQPIELRLMNDSPSTTALSAYHFRFDGGDFLTGKLDATGWTESSALSGLNPAWTPDDQSLDTAAGDHLVSGVSGSLATPLIGPALPVGQSIIIGTLSVYIDAVKNDRVDFIINLTSEIDDQGGNLPGILHFGVAQVLVIPEPASIVLAMLATVALCPRKPRR